MSCLTRCLGKSIVLGVDVMQFCISFPKKSVISSEYWSLTFLFVDFNYVVYFISLESYFTSFKIFILGNSL
jgi:hypothetical protein